MATRATVLAAALAVTLGGCAVASPSQTATPYAASDGVQADLGTVGVRNLILLSEGKGDPGRLIGSVVNSGTSSVQVSFTSDSGTLPTVTVPANGALDLQNTQVTISKLDVLPGLLTPLKITTGGQSTDLQVPVLDGTLQEYKTLVPSASAGSSSGAGSSPSTSSSAGASSSASATG